LGVDYIVRRNVEYFERPGLFNTEKVIELCKKRATDLGIRFVVVASLTGDSTVKVAKAFKDLGVTIISVRFLPGGAWRVKEEPCGAYEAIPELRKMRQEWIKKGLERVPIEYSKKNTDELTKLGVKIVGGTPTLWNVDRSLMAKFGGTSAQEIINETLRLVCPGFRVCVEVALMATDNGAIPTNEEAIVMAGTERGLDTAVVVKPSYSVKMFDLYEGMEIREIICKPRTMLSSKGRFIGRYKILG